MISVDEALEQILSSARLLDVETVPILEALGRVLAEDIYADADIPTADNSAMDGYALRAADVAGASEINKVRLAVLADLPAGYVFDGEIGFGQAVRIMTGAPVPAGADSVVPVEQTERGDGEVAILAEAREGQHVRLAGEDVKKDEQVLARGEAVSAADIGMMASVGRQEVDVIRKPVVAVLATGDELIDVWEEAVPGKVRNSNTYTLASQVARYGGIPKVLGIARDKKDDLTAKIREGLEADILLTSGGVSVGDYDLVKQVLEDLGSMVFWKVAMRPGKPLAFGVIDGKLLFGLPGNPTSSMVSFEQFVRPTMLKMSGHVKLNKPEVEAVVAEDFKKKKGPRMFIRVIVEKRDGAYHARLTGPQGSGILKSMSRADGLLVLPEDSEGIRAGEVGAVQMLDWPEVE